MVVFVTTNSRFLSFVDGAICWTSEVHGERLHLDTAQSQVISQLPSVDDCPLVKVNALSVDVALTLGHRVVPAAFHDREMFALRYWWACNVLIDRYYRGLNVFGTQGSPLYVGDADGLSRMCGVAGLLARDDAIELCYSPHARLRAWGLVGLTVPEPSGDGDSDSARWTQDAALAREHALHPPQMDAGGEGDDRPFHVYMRETFGRQLRFPECPTSTRVWKDVRLDAVDSLHIKIYSGDEARALKAHLAGVDLEQFRMALVDYPRTPQVRRSDVGVRRVRDARGGARVAVVLAAVCLLADADTARVGDRAHRQDAKAARGRREGPGHHPSLRR